MTRQRARTPAGGFTLIELLVTLSVVILGIAGILAMYSSATKVSTQARHSGEAIALCEETIETLGTLSIAEIEAIIGYGPITDAGWGPVPHHEGAVQAPSGIVFGRLVEAHQVVGSGGTLVWLRVRVSWTERGAGAGGLFDHQVTLEVIRSRQETI